MRLYSKRIAGFEIIGNKDVHQSTPTDVSSSGDVTLAGLEASAVLHHRLWIVMWIRLRLDVGWRDLAFAFGYCLMPRKRSNAVTQARQSWSSQDDFLITLSVRSAFDLLLRAMQLPPGSEVLLSALTVPDMVHIVHMHGLVPVPG